jgi:putative membrane protein
MNKSTVNPQPGERPLHRPRTLRQYIGVAARGFCMGSADVVPGVSGGTMAFILGIYQELIESIRSVGRRKFWSAVTKFRFREAIEISNLPFLLALLAGIGTAVLTLAQGLEWALTNHPVYVWAFFFGLVFASVFAVAKRVKRWNVLLAVALILGMTGAWVLVGLVPLQTPESWWFLFLSGAVAICAMILPGISGAFILLLLGKYQYVLSAVNDRNVVPIFWVGLGAMVGIVTFAQVLGWLFRRYHDATVAALTGLMLGSLRKVWPWKVDLEWIIGRHGERLPTVQENVLPSLTTAAGVNMQVVFAAALAIAGFMAVVLLDRWAQSSAPSELQPGS